ncbi:MAG: fasciclin domain-containing protein [Haloferacaceae archaeon]
MFDPQRRKALKTVGTAGVLFALGGVGSASARKGKRQGASGDDTIVDVAVEADDFDVLVEAVQEAGLVDALSGNRQLTVFAPTDEAFGELLDTLGISKEELLASDDLANILLYHVTSGRRYASSVVNAPTVEMLNGETVAVDGTTLNDGQAEIVGTDLEASNGVVHVIDGVLLP